LRKFLIAAFAAVFAVSALSAAAFGQATDTATLTVKVSPTKAGKKKKPKNAAFDLKVVNNNTFRTMSELDIFLAKNVKLNLKGMPKCAPDVIFAENCPKSTVLGTGEAKAKVGVNGDPALIGDRVFEVTAYKTNSPNTGKEMLGFYIDDGQFQFLTETTLTKASGKYGQKLHIDVPQLAQYVGSAPNFTYNGLVSLEIDDLGKKRGKNMLVSTTGCKARKHPYKVDLTFIENTVTRPAVISDTANAGCKK
jgi:hypothetical protein